MHFYLFGLDFLCVLQYNKREVIIMYGQNIRLFRKQKGMNQHELGAAMDVSAVSVSKWEREQTQPDIETLQKLADLFDTMAICFVLLRNLCTYTVFQKSTQPKKSTNLIPKL